MQCMIMLEITNQVPKGIDSKMLQWYSELQCYILGTVIKFLMGIEKVLQTSSTRKTKYLSQHKKWNLVVLLKPKIFVISIFGELGFGTEKGD